MPLSGTESILGLALAAAAGSVDPKGITQWTSVATALLTWLPPNTIVLPGLMVAAGVAVTGLADMQFPAGPTLGPLLAIAAGSVDAIGIANWTAVGLAVVTHLTAFCKGNPDNFVANPVGGPVTGTGKLITAPPIMPTVPPAAGSTDPAGIANWLAVSLAVSSHLMANGQMLATPVGFASPPGGGPLTGTGTIS